MTALFSEGAGGSDGEWEDVDDDDAADDDDEIDDDEAYKSDALRTDQCLFCPLESGSLDENLRHMTIAHSFFVPDLEYVVDLEGLVAYLGEWKFSSGNLSKR